MTQLRAQSVLKSGHGRAPIDTVELDYAGRFLRRKRLVLASGARLDVDLDRATALYHGDAFETTDQHIVGVIAATEDLFKITGDNLVRLAWHIGNRHTPCQVLDDHLLIQPDGVLAHMVDTLGGQVAPVKTMFAPERGAYGHGRTMGHSHDHDHSHD